MILEKIRNNMNIEGIHKFVKKVRAYFPGKYKDFKAVYYMKRVNQQKHSEKRMVKVGFIVQAPEIWDKSVDVYNEMKNRENMQPVILVVPPYNWAEGKLEQFGDDNYFLKTYPDAIKTVNDAGKIMDIKMEKFDYVFYPRPYDQYLPFELRSSEMMKHTRCCYIPYGFSGADVFNSGNTNKEFFRNIYMTFLESDYMKNIFAKKYNQTLRKGIQYFESLGYPCMEKFIKMKNFQEKEKKTILWTPRWSYDEKIGGSNFLEYKDFMMDVCNYFSKAELIFRPHPMMFEELLRTKKIEKEEVRAYVELLEKNGIKFDSGTTIDEAIINTDILITDYSSIIIMFFLTGKPIIYCENIIQLNDVYSKMKECMYVVNNETELKEVLKNLSIGNDYLKSKRQRLIETEFVNCFEASKNIVDKIECDFYKSCN